MKNYKKLKVVCILSAFICIGFVAVKPPVKNDFKNLQVLPKDIHEDTLDKIMDGFTNGLGVSCQYCHVENKLIRQMYFEKDDKPEKEIARLMLRMTIDINKKYFHFNEAEKVDTAIMLQPVTCFTCHRKVPRPVMDSLMNKLQQ